MKTVTVLCLLAAVVAVQADYQNSLSSYDHPTSYVKAVGTPVSSAGYNSLYYRSGYHGNHRDDYSHQYGSYRPNYRSNYGRQRHFGGDDDHYYGHRYNDGRYSRYGYDDDHHDDDRYDDDRYNGYGYDDDDFDH